MLALHDSSDAMESFDNAVSATPKNDLVQTLLTVPLLAASAVAVFMMLPSGDKPKTVNGMATATVGFDGHDHATRQQRLVLARMERTWAQEDLNFGVE